MAVDATKPAPTGTGYGSFVQTPDQYMQGGYITGQPYALPEGEPDIRRTMTNPAGGGQIVEQWNPQFGTYVQSATNGPVGSLNPNVLTPTTPTTKPRTGTKAPPTSAPTPGPLPPRVGSGGGGVRPAPAGPDFDALNAKAQAAQDAALGRAKENAGLIARSALTGLHEAMGERQMLGSGAEAQATGDVAMQGAGLINDVNAQGLEKNSQLAQRLAELSYNGALTARGQDITSDLGHLNADVSQRGQDITARGQDISSSTEMRGQDFQREAAQNGQKYDYTALALNNLKNLVATPPPTSGFGGARFY